jgi:hypothetical protein
MRKLLMKFRNKMPPTPQQQHRTHPVEIRAGSGPHAAQLWCTRCRKHVQWITQAQAELLKGTENGLHKN